MVPPSAHMPMTVTERSISMADPIFMAQDTAKSTRKYRSPDRSPQKNRRCRMRLPARKPPDKQVSRYTAYTIRFTCPSFRRSL